MFLKPTYEKLERRPKEIVNKAIEPNRAERGQEESEDSFFAKKSVAFISVILILFGLYLSSLYNYLLFHSLTEIFSIVVAWAIFIVAWNSRRIMDNNYLLFIGVAFLFIGGLDLFHTLGYRGMEIFHGYTANLPTQLWIAARYMESLSLLIAPLFLTRRLRTDLVLIVYALVTALVLGSVFYWHIFPMCFVEGVGLTPFKKISEYVISIILIGAITLLFQKRKEFDEKVFRLLVAAMVITIAAELAFTFYISAYGFSNLVGHYFKIISFYLIYKAIIETGLTRPYALLFRNLKRNEEALQKSEERFHNMFAKHHAVMLIIEPDTGDILDANLAAERFYGYPIDRLRFMKITDINRLSPDQVAEERRRAASEERNYFVFPHELASGEERIVEVHSSPISFQERHVLFSIVHDITERKKAEALISKSNALLTSVINQAPFAIHILEGAYNNINVVIENAESARIMGEVVEGRTGIDADTTEMLTTRFFSIDGKQEIPLSQMPSPRAFQGEVVINEEFIFHHSNGTQIMVEASASPICDVNNQIIAVAVIFQDITKRKKAEKEREQSSNQLTQSQKMEAVGTLAGGIAHDFNNILAIILGNAELAADDVPEGNPAAGCLEEIRLASIRAKDMVQQLLSFSRKTDQKKKSLNLVPVINESMKMLRTAIPSSVEFGIQIPNDPCNILGDTSQINQIIMNLTTNAADAMSEEGGVLEVTLQKILLRDEKPCFDWVLSPGAYIRLRVRDTGEGIAPETMARIFEPYYTTKDIGKGTGMGLSVIHGIVKRHNGGIRVESEPGRGTVFEIYFPALEEMDEEEKEPEEEIKGGSESILFVDDEESLVNLNRQRLERLGYQVKSTTKPVEALEWFRADPDQFDVIITDMTMPRMTGDRLTTEVLKIRPHMPVIICTGYSERMSAKKAEALGVQKYIEKPIDLRNLASSLRAVLDEK